MLFRLALLTAITLCRTPAPAQVTEPFLPAPSCALCHSRITGTGAGETVGQFHLWSGSMMAHASRDPYWKAKVRHEAALTPSAGRVIEDKCLRCHAPAQQYRYRGSAAGMTLDGLPPDGGEGVTCTVCHQISSDGLGAPESFTGGFRIGVENRIFGPHEDPFLMPMLHHTGYTATHSPHMLEAGLCGTCHTVITPTLDSTGRVLGEFIEQATYLEWLASDFSSSGVTCQSCHVPLLANDAGSPLAQYIAHRPPGGPFPPTRPRSPFGLHFFAGANTAMLEALAGIFPDERPALSRVADRARGALASALQLDVKPSVDGDIIHVTVEVRNRSGHKLPTGFPSRRLWLETRILDADGTALFESGTWDRATGELSASAAQPHRSVITSPSEAMVYEAAYLDADGSATMSLLRAAAYAKDNRILPRGFDLSRALPGGLSADRIGPAGTASDAGFRSGSHQVRYDYRRTPGSRPARVTVAAWYQSIAPAHAAALTGDHPDIRFFQTVYPGARMPVLAASREVDLAIPER